MPHSQSQSQYHPYRLSQSYINAVSQPSSSTHTENGRRSNSYINALKHPAGLKHLDQLSLSSTYRRSKSYENAMHTVEDKWI